MENPEESKIEEATTQPGTEAHEGETPDAAIVALPTKEEGVLDDGRKFEVKKGRGKHAIDATGIIAGKPYNGDQRRYIPAIMSMLTLIEGKKYPLEYYEEMDLSDYMTISHHFGEKNFSGRE